MYGPLPMKGSPSGADAETRPRGLGPGSSFPGPKARIRAPNPRFGRAPVSQNPRPGPRPLHCLPTSRYRNPPRCQEAPCYLHTAPDPNDTPHPLQFVVTFWDSNLLPQKRKANRFGAPLVSCGEHPMYEHRHPYWFLAMKPPGIGNAPQNTEKHRGWSQESGTAPEWISGLNRTQDAVSKDVDRRIASEQLTRSNHVDKAPPMLDRYSGRRHGPKVDPSRRGDRKNRRVLGRSKALFRR